MRVTVEYLGSGLTICRSMRASKVRGPRHVHLVTIVGSCETAATRSATWQTLPVAALALTVAAGSIRRIPLCARVGGRSGLEPPDQLTANRVRGSRWLLSR